MTVLSNDTVCVIWKYLPQEAAPSEQPPVSITSYQLFSPPPAWLTDSASCSGQPWVEAVGAEPRGTCDAVSYGRQPWPRSSMATHKLASFCSGSLTWINRCRGWPGVEKTQAINWMLSPLHGPQFPS